MSTTKFVINTITNEKIMKSEPLNEEVFFSSGIMITETNLEGIITYANSSFQKITGFSKEELIGSPHSLNRHPDMPRGLFKAMWKIITAKKVWRGYVKNMTKDGKFYWTLLYVQPKFNAQDELIGYVAARKIPYPESIEEAEKKYMELYEDEHIDNELFMRAELFHGEYLAKKH